MLKNTNVIGVHMNNKKTLYDDWITDLRKILICFAIILLSAIPALEESKALSIAILAQGVSNIDGYWDFLKEREICKPLKIMLVGVVILSCAASIIAILSLSNEKSYFEISKYHVGYIMKAITLLAVSFPTILLITDGILNAKIEEDEIEKKSEENKLEGGEEDEL